MVSCAVCRVAHACEPAFVPSHPFSCKYSRAPLRPGQAHPSGEPERHALARAHSGAMSRVAHVEANHAPPPASRWTSVLRCVCVCVCTKVGEHPMSVCLSLSQPRLQVGRVAAAGRLAGAGARRALGSRAAVGIPPWATDPNRAKRAVCCTPAHRGQAKA
jgi:hypothetical protein